MKVYIYEAYYPAGGTYMAYQVGRILHQYFGKQVFVVGDSIKTDRFTYQVEFPIIQKEEFERNAMKDDLLICNPGFSDLKFGIRLPCKKLSYIQGIRTFSILDVFFDTYVFVSGWARSFVEAYYGITGSVIPAFVDAEFFSRGDSWNTRSKTVAMIRYKHDDILFEKFVALFKKHHGEIPNFEIVSIKRQKELAQALKKYRYFLSLAVMEGFGLPMLEAMAAGCTVIGWDSGGCHEYAVSGENCLLAKYGDMECLANQLNFALCNDKVSDGIAAKGAVTAERFSRDSFDRLWIEELMSIV